MPTLGDGGAAISRVEPAIRTMGGARGTPNGKHQACGHFEMPLHYPRYTKADYETMPEWKLDCLLAQYGLPILGDNLEQKRKFAMGAFLWTN